MPPTGQLQYFRSEIDGQLHPCAVCATDTSDEPKPLILEVSPGAISDLKAAVGMTEQIAGIAQRQGRSCVALRPTGRGPGSVYQNYGEVDVLEAIEHVATHYPIDRDRISITGSSMGGAAVWYLISHYPDLFSAAAPFCGYCDYRLWEKPGGLTFHMHPWEEPSWRSRSAAFLVENLQHTPVWMVHGEWDRGVGGGVPVEHSRQMARLMAERGCDHRLTEVPETGHGCRKPEIFQEIVPWLLDQTKTRDPDHVNLKTYGLRHNRSYWVTIEQLVDYAAGGTIDARLTSDGLIVDTEGVRTFSLDPPGGLSETTVNVDGQALSGVDIGRGQTFRRSDDGSWAAGEVDPSSEKRHGSSGPIGDLFFDRVILVPGTSGSSEATFFNDWCARDAQGYYRNRNGGVHRGGIMGQNWVDLPIVSDVDLSDGQSADSNLLLYGDFQSNAVLARFEGRVPLSFGAGRIDVGGKTWSGDGVTVFAVFPHPDNEGRCIAVHGGTTPDAICWGTHLDMGLLPDYVVYARGEVLEWGHWRNDWKAG